jgi:hypothetical protein
MTTPANEQLVMTGPVQDLSTHRLPPNFRGRPAWFGLLQRRLKDVPPMMLCMVNPLKVIRPRVVTDTPAQV